MKSAALYALLLLSASLSASASDSLRSTLPVRTIATQKPHSYDPREPSYFEKYVKPKSVKALINYCATQWMQEEKDSFAAMPEQIAIRHHHYWYDIWINSMWGILVNDSSVTADFKTYGITENEDKWLIILTSLHRQLNHQDVNLPAQVREIKKRKMKRSSR